MTGKKYNKISTLAKTDVDPNHTKIAAIQKQNTISIPERNTWKAPFYGDISFFFEYYNPDCSSSLSPSVYCPVSSVMQLQIHLTSMSPPRPFIVRPIQKLCFSYGLTIHGQSNM